VQHVSNTLAQLNYADPMLTLLWQIGVNPANPLIVGPVLAVDSLAATFMPAYLILEAARVGKLQIDESGS
jgi:hypothetical protein